MFERNPLFPALDEIIDFFGNKWSEKSVGMRVNEEVSKTYFEEGVSMLKNFYKKNPPWNFNAVELESRFEIIIEDEKNNESHILAGIIDRIDKPRETDVYEIIDYKTSKRMPSKEMLDKNLQLAVYNLGLLKKWPHLKPENVKLSLYFLKHNEKIETTKTAVDLENNKKEILETIKEIQNLIELTRKERIVCQVHKMLDKEFNKCDVCFEKQIINVGK